MPAALVTIGTTMLADLTAANGLGRLSQPITARRMYVPKFQPGKQTVGVYQVIVGGGSEQSKRLSNSAISVEYTFEIGVCCRMSDLLESTIEPAMQLIQEMADLFFDYGLSDNSAQWIRNETYFWGDPERLKMDGAFFALWDCVFTGTRSKPTS